MPKPRAALLTVVFVLSTAAPGALVAADLRVDQLELLSHGSLNNDTGNYEVASNLFFDMSLEGGDKFAGLLKLDFMNNNVENALNLANTNANSSSSSLGQDLTDRVNNLTSPMLRTVAITARSMFDMPLDFSYFVGEMDNFCSGDEFVPLFGAAPFATELRGPLVYPDGVGGNPKVWYDGIYAANGTGFRVSTTPKLSERSVGYLYFYQDSNVGPGTWSGDLRFLRNGSSVKTEVFAGATTGNVEATRGLYRWGLLFFASPGDTGEFLAQLGVTRWDATRPLSLDDLFFLFEPRVYIGSARAAITVFYHPTWYLQKDYSDLGEKGALDTAFDLRFGNVNSSSAQGGMQTLLAFRPLSEDTAVTPRLAVDVSPYYALVSGGVRWDFKFDLRLFPYPDEWYGMFRPFVGLKTSY
jgi:hypothetical protein